jgi:hypothetical protein
MTWLIIPSLSLSLFLMRICENIRLAARGNQIRAAVTTSESLCSRKMDRNFLSKSTGKFAAKKYAFSRARSPPPRRVYISPIKLLRVGTFNSHLEVKLKLEIPNVLRRFKATGMARPVEALQFTKRRPLTGCRAACSLPSPQHHATRETLFRTLTHVDSQIAKMLYASSGKVEKRRSNLAHAPGFF